jgi:hypothetical protein
VALPVGSGKLHYNAAVASGGTGNVESTATGLTAATAESAWETYNQGPVGFQAIGPASVAAAARIASMNHGGRAAHASRRTHRLRPRVAIGGAPAVMLAGTSAQLSAVLAGGRGPVRWSASAGAISPGGLFTAPAGGRTVVLRANYPGAHADTLRVRVVAAAEPRPAPAAVATVSSGPAAARAAGAAPVGALQAMLFGKELVVTAQIGTPGRVELSAQVGTRELGSCSLRTPGGFGFTCRLAMRGASAVERMTVVARVWKGRTLIARRRISGFIPNMKMVDNLPAFGGKSVSPLEFICSPALRYTTGLHAAT